VIILRDEEKVNALPIYIDPMQAAVITYIRERKTIERPITVDVVSLISKALDAELEEVIINEVKEGVFYAKLVLKKNEKIISIDVRPSDAIAISVNEDLPIFCSKNVMDEAGVDFSSIRGAVSNDTEEI